MALSTAVLRSAHVPFLGTRTIVGAPAFHVEDTHVESVVFSRSFGFAVTQFDVRGRGTVKSSVPRTRGRPVRGRSAGLRGLAGPLICERDEKKRPVRRGPIAARAHRRPASY